MSTLCDKEEACQPLEGTWDEQDKQEDNMGYDASDTAVCQSARLEVWAAWVFGVEYTLLRNYDKRHLFERDKNTKTAVIVKSLLV